MDAGLLANTVNHHLVAQGLVYPLYYSTLFRRCSNKAPLRIRDGSVQRRLWICAT